MNQGPLVYLGAFFALCISWLGFVLAPQLQIGSQSEVVVQSTGEAYPPMRAGMARQGEQVYRANGCFYCHSQMVRPAGMGSDAERGWGGRSGKVQTVAQDYLYDSPVMLGSQRVGPDLENYGLRQTNETTILTHLYNPKLTMPNSVMPPYQYLFIKRKLGFGEKPSDEALPVNAEAGYEVVPKDEARQLASYLLSLHSDAVIFEAPPKPLPPKPAGATNAAATKAAAPTNSPAK